MIDRTANGRAFKILNVIDEYTQECLAILIARKIKNQDVINLLFHLFIFRGTLFIELGSPWENGYIESFDGKLRDEFLNREIFATLEEAKVLIKQWQMEYNI
jgi:transposase InsO family protein